MFFCVRLPIIHSRGPYVEYQDFVADFSQPALSALKQPAAQQTLQQPTSAVPNLIPRVIHQTYSNGRLPASAKSFMKSWAEVNGESWQVRTSVLSVTS
jgi:mannosyltransferase OCH1-like enzyme